MEYPKKSYKLFVLWLFLLVVIMLITDLILSNLLLSIDVATKIFIILLNTWILSLLFLIYKTERIYWINGITYEKAKSMTSEERKLYVWRHIIKFGQGTLVTLIYLTFSYLMNLSIVLDLIICVLIIIISAFRTISIKA